MNNTNWKVAFCVGYAIMIFSMGFHVGLTWNAPVYSTVGHQQHSQSNNVEPHFEDTYFSVFVSHLLLGSVLFAPAESSHILSHISPFRWLK